MIVGLLCGLLDSYGKQLFVAPPPVLMQSGHTKRIGLSNRWRDGNGRFCKSPECIELSGSAKRWFEQTIHPMDEPYPMAYPPLPASTIRE